MVAVNSYAYGDSTIYYASHCKHHFTPVKVGQHTIYCSGYSGWTFPERATVKNPDLGVYLDPAWLGVSTEVVVSGNITCPIKPTYDTVIANWEDYGTGADGVTTWLVELITTALNKRKRVELGCFGGHGRTGTLLACLLTKVENLSAYQAIQAVRNRYCKEAIESRTQVKHVFEFVGQKMKNKHIDKLGFGFRYSRKFALLDDGKITAGSSPYTSHGQEPIMPDPSYAHIGGQTNVKTKEGKWIPLRYAQWSQGGWGLKEGVSDEELETQDNV